MGIFHFDLLLFFYKVFQLLVFVDNRVSEKLIVYNFIAATNYWTNILLLLLHDSLMHFAGCVIVCCASPILKTNIWLYNGLIVLAATILQLVII